MAISAFAGVGFALLARGQSNVVKAIGLGAAYGVAWWVVGALVLMPAGLLGMPIFAFNEMSMQSLMGHVLFRDHHGCHLCRTYPPICLR